LAYICKNCGKQYDITLFQFGIKILCECGEIVDATEPMEINLIDDDEEKILKKIEETKLRKLQRLVDRVCCLILISDYPEEDIEIEIEKVKEECLKLFPDKLYLYRMVYESRFKRLHNQFRKQ